MITIAICDYDNETVNFVKGIMKKWFFGKCMIVSCNNEDSLIASLERHHFNFFFIGIGQPWVKILQAIEAMRKNNSDSRIVFMGNERNIPSEAFSCNPVGYISKSNIKEDMKRILDVITDYIEECREFPAKKGFHYIHIYDIMYAEIYDHIITIYTSGIKYEVYMTMDELERQIGDYGMIRVHKSFLVNYRCVSSITPKDVILNNGYPIPLSKKRSKEVRSKIRTFLNID